MRPWLGNSTVPFGRSSTKSAEVKRRLTDLLEDGAAGDEPQRLRQRRAVAALERMGTAEARELLHTLAGGALDSPLTQDARAALGRIHPPGP